MGGFAVRRQNLTQRVTACDWHINAQYFLDGIDNPFGLCLQKHLPGSVHQYERQNWLGVTKIIKGVSGGLDGSFFAVCRAAHHQPDGQP